MYCVKSLVSHTYISPPPLKKQQFQIRRNFISLKNLFPLFCNPLGAGSEMSPLNYRRRYDNVLPGQGHHTPQEAVTDECGTIVDDQQGKAERT
jgi:hypothetical protein